MPGRLFPEVIRFEHSSGLLDDIIIIKKRGHILKTDRTSRYKSSPATLKYELQ